MFCTNEIIKASLKRNYFPINMNELVLDDLVSHMMI
jgi:hypothetical protein